MTEDRDTDAVVELGTASELTQGQARVDIDVSGGQARFLTGIAEN